MSIKIETVVLIKCSCTEEGLLPDTLCISEETVTDWVEGVKVEDMDWEYEIEPHPFPEDGAYSLQDFIGDLNSSGSWTLPKEIGEDTKDWIIEFLEEHI